MRCLATLLLLTAPLIAQQRFEISWPEASDGRLILILSKAGGREAAREPRLEINEGLETQQMFGVDIDNARSATIDNQAPGYPLLHLNDVPAGEYTCKRSSTSTKPSISPMAARSTPHGRGEGQQWNSKPGNYYSEPARMRIDPTAAAPIRIELDQNHSSHPAARRYPYIKHVKIQSKLLSQFWGRPMYLGAIVLLPEGFD